jgi:superfamily I DNA/RNA helicase
VAGSDLNDRQRQAVEHSGGPLLVLAGPGTGKTGVLVARIAHLVADRSVSPGRILALTFSRRAAEEMHSRVKDWVPEAAFIETRTFHSFALSVVRRHAAVLGLRRAQEIIPTGEQWALISDLLLDEDPARWGLAQNAFDRPATVREVYDLLLRAQEHLHGPEDLSALAGEFDLPYLERAGTILELFRDRLSRAARVDYEGVVRLALDLLAEGCSARQELSGRYDHVLVDEFQDTNRSQLELIRRLMPGERPNVFCVGDDAQSIYGFRGARIENVRDFRKHFPQAREVHLRTNYRSADGIVSLAEAAIRADGEREGRDKQMVHSEKPGTVLYRVAGSSREEGEWIAERIVELNRAHGVPFEEIAILRRSLLDADPLVDALAARSIPVDLPAAARGSTARHLAALLKATGAASEEPDTKTASMALTTPLAGVSPAAARSLRGSAEASGRSVFELLSSGDSVGGVSEDEMQRAREVVCAVREAGEQESFTEKVETLWKALPGTRELFERHAEDAEAARELMDAMAFVRSARAYASVSQRPTIEGFLRAGKMLHEDSDTWAPAAPPAEGAVRVLTVHGSKGLEFEAVFVSGLTEDRFPVRARGVQLVDQGLLSGNGPTARADLESRHLSEERRLLYVAITRAKIYLYLTGVEESAKDGAKASSFLRELEDRLIELEERSRARRFWTSREEAVEELRRTACDTALPVGSRFAACRALAGMGEDTRTWWRYADPTPGRSPKPSALELDAGEIVAHMNCPRRAFMQNLAPAAVARQGMRGKMRFGSAFKRGFRRYLQGEYESLEEAMSAAVESGRFGGSAITEYWRRQAIQTAASCETWARDLREKLLSTGGTFELAFGDHIMRGHHDTVFEESGARVLVRVKSGKTAASGTDAAADPELALAALGAEADEARLEYPRHFAYRKPARRPLSTSEGWRERWREETERAFAEIGDREIPPKPRTEKQCDNCAFISICPLHAEDEPWLG